MTLLLPSVEAYSDWKDWARAVTTALDQAGITDAGQQQRNYYDITHLDPDSLPSTPAGYHRLWLSATDAKLFLENPTYDPPDADDIVFIDTAAIADAAIKTDKIDSLAVIKEKIANAGVGTTKIESLAITEALIAQLAVGEAKIADLAVKSGKIGLAAIVTALIGDLQVTTGKVNDLAVNSGKMANLAVTSGKIANLSIGATHILDAAIGDAHIAGVIQSRNWNLSTKQGWQLDKDGSIRGNAIEIYNALGQLIFGSSGAPWATAITGRPNNLSALTGTENILNTLLSLTPGGALEGGGGGQLDLGDIPGLIDRLTQTTGFGAIAALDAVSYGSSYLNGFGALAALSSLARTGGQLTGFGAVAGENVLTNGGSYLSGFGAVSALDSISRTGGYLTGFGDIAALSTLSYGSSNLLGFGTFAALTLLNSGNISTYIAGAAIGSALIANLAVGTAHINDLAVSEAKIQDLAVTSAKIANLVVNKITSGQLDAVIDVGSGMLKFSIGASAMYIGRGFGTTSQFFLWFGPNSVTPAAATETNGVVWFKTNGDAYFGGSLSAGILRTSRRTTSLMGDAFIESGAFSSNGGNRAYTASYYWHSETTVTANGSISGQPSVVLVLEKYVSGAWTELARQTINGTATPTAWTASPSEPAVLIEDMGGSFTFTDTSGGTLVDNLQARIENRVLKFGGGSPQQQEVSVTSVEE